MKPSTTSAPAARGCRCATGPSGRRTARRGWRVDASCHSVAVDPCVGLRDSRLRSPVYIPTSAPAPRQQLVDDRVGRDAFRLGAEVREHAVAQHRVRHRADVVEADVIAALGQRARLGAEHQVLRRAHAGAEGDELLHRVGRLLRLRAGWCGRAAARSASPARPPARAAPAAGTRPGRRRSPGCWKCGSMIAVVARTTSNSSSSGGCSMTMWNMKRSSCASGSG